MSHKISKRYRFLIRKHRVRFLAVSAVMGAFAGYIFVCTSGNLLSSMMRLAAFRQMSIFGPMVTAFLPFVFSFVAISAFGPWLLYPICFGRAFLFSAGTMGVYAAFGSAGWLMCWLLSFTGQCTMPLHLCFFLRLQKGTTSLRLDMLGFAAVALFVVIADHCIVSPFLVNLMRSYETTGRFAISCWI